MTVPGRNALCQCGSGKRFKDCCGSLVATSASLASADAAYQPAGKEWASMTDAMQQALGAKMDRAMRLQQRGEAPAAALLYREVLAAAPATHDALHMLGVTEMMAGRPHDAEWLIREAMALRQPYTAIRKNLQLAVSAARRHTGTGRQQRFESRLQTILASRVAEPGARAAAASQGGFHDPATGDDDVCLHAFHWPLYPCAEEGDTWFVRRLAALLPSAVSLRDWWAGSAGGSTAPEPSPSRSTDPGSMALPPLAKVLIVGASINIEMSGWRPKRVVLFCTSGSIAEYAATISRLHAATDARVELAFRSDAARSRFGLAGHVLVPPIELPKAETRAPDVTADAARPFIVGYVAPREESLLPPAPSALWRALGEVGVSVLLRGASRQRQPLGAIRGIEVRSRQMESLTSFLSRVDCLVYDVNHPEDEGWGIELFSAMAMGTPVLCSTRSCYATKIAHGSNGFVCSNDADFLRSVDDLRKSKSLVTRIGAAAREFATAEFAVDALRRHYQWLAYG